MADEDLIHLTHSSNPLAMFALSPVGVSFETQQKGEKIILMLRAHIITLTGAFLEILFLAILPILVGLLDNIGIDPYAGLVARQVFWLNVSWYLFTFGFAFYRFIFWYFNVYLVTNERIVDFDFRGILHKETAYANLSQIQDVTPKILGFFQTFFHYGNVFIQTAAAKNEFEFNSVENPDMVAREILEQVRLEEAELPGEIK